MASATAGGDRGSGAGAGDKDVPRNNKLVERLQGLIDARKTNAHAVARKADLAVTYVYDVLNRRNLNPSVQAIQAIAQVLETTLAYLMGESDHVSGDTRIKVVETMPIISTAESGTYRRPAASNTAYPMIHGPRSQNHPDALHFAVYVNDDALNARLGGAPITVGMIGLCVDMVDAGLIVESGRLYCVRRTLDKGKTWETVLRSAQVFRDKTLLVPESTNPSHDKIVIPGELMVTRSFPWSAAANQDTYAIGLLYAVMMSCE
jgi:transcriptional regulator with XRE-family HTH domain